SKSFRKVTECNLNRWAILSEFTTQARFGVLTSPSSTGPAIPKQARLIETCCPARNSSTTGSRPGYCLLGNVLLSSDLSFSPWREKSAKWVLVPPMSPARMKLLPVTVFRFLHFQSNSPHSQPHPRPPPPLKPTPPLC